VSREAPLVAVVTPVYNGEAYLQETIDAVQAQTHRNLVHVLLDNASTDRTPAIISANQGRKVPIVTARNPQLLPITRNWNTAVRLAPAEAKYFRILCADDSMRETCIERMVEVAETDPDILVVGVGTVLQDSLLDFHWPKDRVTLDGAELIRGFLRRELGFFAIHTLTRRSVLEWRPDVFDESYSTGNDFESVLGILRRGKLGMVHESLGWTRVHQESETSRVMLKKNTHYMDWLRALYRHGPHVFSPAEFREVAKRYERRYLRLVLKWQWQYGRAAVQHHWDALERERGPITALDYADVALDWALIRAGVRERLTGWP
jgi:glycosyltransferase involved in cell wall biosynthesis